jgi:type I restriction enzyme M protein
MLIESARYIAEQPNGKVGNNSIAFLVKKRTLEHGQLVTDMLLHNFMDVIFERSLITPQHKKRK